MIGSVAMMLETSFNLTAEAKLVWEAMKSVFEAGYTTADLKGTESNTPKLLSTIEFGDKVMEKLEALLSK